ncbi:RHS repeat domain-containing protein [Sphingobacterium spiritivorum]|uniref:RHS repeat domain-containing protein n=1 Tax=Sphingobacterium spiritivorum TaxID=258 RepID=UPI001F1DFC25|nr:RHS repeat-associated core domain-containing protein [Sphingobacterium spiritivorum]
MTGGGNTITYQYYAGGIEYQNGVIELIHTAEGVAYRNANGTYTYRYNLTDHLGNVRATIYRNPSTNAVEVLQRDDYYPFGLQKSPNPVYGNNKYLYNGKEKQEELGGQLDYGARFYDPVIGRWNVADPLAEKYYPYSAYNYTLNDPIGKLDPNGMWVATAEGWSTNDPNDIAEFMQQMQGDDQDKGGKKKNQQDPPKKGRNSKGGTNDVYGDGGKVLYNGKAMFGTNFIGPGPDEDPRDLGLVPLDMIDMAAMNHDLSYFINKSSGIKGAFIDLKVLDADKKLVKEAFKVIKQYKKGGD